MAMDLNRIATSVAAFWGGQKNIVAVSSVTHSTECDTDDARRQLLGDFIMFSAIFILYKSC